MPVNPKDQFVMSYLGKASPRLTLFTEFKYGSGSTIMGGYRFRFPSASITGYVDSKGKTYATYSKSLEEGAMKVDFNS